MHPKKVHQIITSTKYFQSAVVPGWTLYNILPVAMPVRFTATDNKHYIVSDLKQCIMKTSPIQTSFRILLGLLMTFAGIGHLTFQRKEFLAQVPGWLPNNPSFKDFVVLSSGIVEIMLGLAMIFIVNQKVKVGLILAIFYILIFPGNISQYTNRIDAFGLDTDQKRFIRLLLQPVLVIWALWSTGALKHLLTKQKNTAN